jgi:hypothetical protein
MAQPSSPLSNLSQSVTQRLNGYALAAGAPGLSVWRREESSLSAQ